jgi:hypothetical protein
MTASTGSVQKVSGPWYTTLPGFLNSASPLSSRTYFSAFLTSVQVRPKTSFLRVGAGGRGGVRLPGDDFFGVGASAPTTLASVADEDGRLPAARRLHNEPAPALRTIRA